MIDCPNAEIRDRLPDLLHDRLDAGARATVLAHLDGCAACRAELTLLRELREELTRAPTLDVGLVTRVVVARTVTASAASPATRKPSWGDWRIAAAIAVLAIGGAALTTLYIKGHAPIGTDTMLASTATVTPVRAAGGTSSVRQDEPIANVQVQTAELSMGGGVADLSEGDLRALLDEIEALDALPVAEPEPVAVRVALPPGSSE